MSKKLIIFDFDGTLVDTRIGIAKSFNYALQKNNLSTVDNQQIYDLIGLPLEQMFMVYSSEFEILSRDFREDYNANGYQLYEVYDQIEELILTLYNSGSTLVIATTKRQPSVNFILEELGWLKYFELVIDGSMVTDNKPNVESFDLIKSRYSNIPNSEIIMIGDTHIDWEFAKNACIDVFIVNYGYDQKNLISRGNIEQLQSILGLRRLLSVESKNPK